MCEYVFSKNYEMFSCIRPDLQTTEMCKIINKYTKFLFPYVRLDLQTPEIIKNILIGFDHL